MTFILTNRVIREIPNGFCGAVVEGKRGIGKSSYCLKTMMQIYSIVLHLSERDAYKMALDNTLYEIEDIIRALRKATDTDTKIPVLTWDDAGVHGSSIQWFMNMEAVNELKAITDTIRTAVIGFILNCTDRSGLLSHLRHYDDYLIEIIKNANGGGNTFEKENGEISLYKSYERIARGYVMYKLPSGKHMIKKQFEDEYSCYIPKYIYDQYMEKRQLYLKKALKNMEEMRNEKLTKHKYNKVDDQLKRIELELKADKFKKKGYDVLIPNGDSS